MRAGRSVATAITTGYRKGLTAIIDANIVTFLVAFILFIIATAGVQGFAFTLGLGVIVSLFTAVLATQAILYSLRGTRLLASKAALGAGEQKSDRWRIDYMGKAKWFFSFSGCILLVCALAMSGKGINFGIDFDGGTRITAPLERAATVDQVRDAVAPLGLAEAKIQTLQNPELGQHVVQISTKELPKGGSNAVVEKLNSSFGQADRPNIEEIGPSFGQTVARSAIYAIIASLLIISIYIALRFEWKFAVPVLIALMHDILIVAGVYALTGREVTTSTVAALLTILGYSLYDTIIVFDRVRENIPRMPSAAFSQIVNRSLSEVIVRSLATSFCTLLPVAALMLFGGETLRDFAFALLIGIASGTYSSIFIATPVLQHWKEREPGFRARRARILERLGSVPPYATAEQGGPIDVQPKEHGAQAHDLGPARPGGLGVRVPGDGARPRRRGGDGPARQPPARRHRRPAGVPPAAAAHARGPRAQTDHRRPTARRPRPVTARAATPRTANPAIVVTGGRADMALLVWTMVGLALWHFTVFLPDNFYGGIVGAFCGALLGANIFGIIVNLGSIPGESGTDLMTGVEAIPGTLIGLGIMWWLGVRQLAAEARRARGGPLRT